MILDIINKEEVLAYLINLNLVGENDLFVEHSIAGEGNMNVVMRLKTQKASLILKQSKPYVNKYPSIAAPLERIEVESEYFKAVGNAAILSKKSPKILHFDEKNSLIVMEDLGEGSDFLALYQDTNLISKSELKELISYLIELHSLKVEGFPSNAKMKLLNHEHIFNFPFEEENGFNLDDVQKGLQGLSMTFKGDALLKSKITKVGERYLKTGKSLLHGDFYPGSWLKVADGLKVIDPEFGFMGDPEFDLGVMLAHLKMSGFSDEMIDFCKNDYNDNSTLDMELLNQYQGIEIMRRLIGIAQLPLKMTLEEKSAMLSYARDLILD